MKILVTGQHGQVARSLGEAGPRDGVKIVLAGRPELDLCNASSVTTALAREQPDVVINAAAYTQVDAAETDEAAAFAANADGAAAIAQACAARDVPLIHLSTDYVFDGAKDGSYGESDSVAPINAYGRSKLAGERNVAAHCPKHLIVRTSWVHSPWGKNFVLTMLNLAETRAALNVVADQHGCPTYAPHLANALLAMAQRAASDPEATQWGIYNAAGQGKTNWCEMAREIFRVAASEDLPAATVSPIRAANYPTPARRPANSRLYCSALQSAFGIALPDWQSGIRDCVARVARERRSKTKVTAA